MNNKVIIENIFDVYAECAEHGGVVVQSVEIGDSVYGGEITVTLKPCKGCRKKVKKDESL